MSQQDTTQVAQPTLNDLVDHLTTFEGPPEEFLLRLLAVQCHIASAVGGAILRPIPKGTPEVLAVFPAPQENETAPVWLAQSVELASRVAEATDTVVTALQAPEGYYDQSPQQHLVMIPIRASGKVRGVAAYAIHSTESSLLAESRQRLELTISLLSLHEMRLTLQHRHGDLKRLRQGLELLAAVNENDRFRAAAMALCNEIASVWQAERVSLGFLKGRYVRAVALSHTERFTRKMKLVLDIESAMEECFDQDLEIMHPPPAEATFVSRATGTLASRHGPTAICSLPLRIKQKTIAVLTVERNVDRPFTSEDMEVLRLICELCTARLSDLYEHDKWMGAKAADMARDGLAKLTGPEHTWIKAIAAGVFIAAVFFTFAKGNDHAEGSFVVEAITRQLVPAPYPGHLARVEVEVGDEVVQGKTLLAALDARQLRSELMALQQERRRALKEKDVNLSLPGQQAQVLMAEAEAEGISAQIRLKEFQLEQAEIYAPISGILIKGDLKKELGAPVDTGRILFEIAPLNAFRAEVAMPEDRITDLKVGQKGQLAPVAQPGLYLPVIVERITPVAQVINQRNVFNVRVKFDQNNNQWAEAVGQINLTQGLEGVARIKVGRARYLWLWTRDMVNWVRMKLWW